MTNNTHDDKRAKDELMDAARTGILLMLSGIRGSQFFGPAASVRQSPGSPNLTVTCRGTRYNIRITKDTSR